MYVDDITDRTVLYHFFHFLKVGEIAAVICDETGNTRFLRNTVDTCTPVSYTHLDVYKRQTLGRALDEKAPSYQLQSLGWSYHAPYAGHDGIQLAVGQVFTLGEDFLFPYYRDMLTVLSAGMTAEEIILNGISKATDPGSGGRHMSNHFAKPEWHIENISSATGTHDLHAAGVARAMVYYGHKGCLLYTSRCV